MARPRKRSSRGWTSENVRIAKAVSNKHAALVWICNMSAKRVERRQKITGVVIAAGLYLFGTTGVPSVLSDTDKNNTNEIILLVIAILSIAFGLFKTVIVALQEDKKVGKNRWALGIHAELTKDIRKELQKKPYKRILWRKFYKDIEEKDIELQKDAPTPPKAVLKAYYEKFGKDAIKERILFGGLNDIENARGGITVDHRLSNGSIGRVAKGNRERKKEMRDFIASLEENSDESELETTESLSIDIKFTKDDPEDSPAVRKAEEKRREPRKPRKHVEEPAEEPVENVDAHAESHDSSSPVAAVAPAVAPNNAGSDERTTVKRPGQAESPRTRARRRQTVRMSTLDRRRVAAVAARHDMRDRYELERYYLE